MWWINYDYLRSQKYVNILTLNIISVIKQIKWSPGNLALVNWKQHHGKSAPFHMKIIQATINFPSNEN